MKGLLNPAYYWSVSIFITPCLEQDTWPETFPRLKFCTCWEVRWWEQNGKIIDPRLYLTYKISEMGSLGLTQYKEYNFIMQHLSLYSQKNAFQSKFICNLDNLRVQAEETLKSSWCLKWTRSPVRHRNSPLEGGLRESCCLGFSTSCIGTHLDTRLASHSAMAQPVFPLAHATLVWTALWSPSLGHSDSMKLLDSLGTALLMSFSGNRKPSHLLQMGGCKLGIAIG